MPPKGKRANRRAEIVAATEALIRSEGLAGTTTRAIAARVGCSEGAIYVHFPGRLQLLLAVLEESLPSMLKPLEGLETAAGKATPARNLAKALGGMFKFHERVLPVLASLFAEPALLALYRQSLLERRKGPQGGIGRLERYLETERQLGRIGKSCDTGAVAGALMAASFFHAFTNLFFGRSEPFAPIARKVVAALLRQP